MKNILKVLGLSLVLFLFVGCGVQTVYNVEKAPINVSKKTKLEDVYKAITRAAISKGWRVKEIEPGVAQAMIVVRAKHTAIVMINYSLESFSIEYKNSDNLNYDAEKNTIHKNYNSWIQNLEKAIELEFYSM